MGSAKIDLTQLELGKAEDINLSLSDTNNGEPGLSMGEILINLTLWPRSQEDKEMVSKIYDTIRCDYDWICNSAAEGSSVSAAETHSLYYLRLRPFPFFLPKRSLCHNICHDIRHDIRHDIYRLHPYRYLAAICGN